MQRMASSLQQHCPLSTPSSSIFILKDKDERRVLQYVNTSTNLTSERLPPQRRPYLLHPFPLRP